MKAADVMQFGLLLASSLALAACGAGGERATSSGGASSSASEAAPPKVSGDHMSHGESSDGMHQEGGEAGGAASAWSAMNALRDQVARAIADGKLSAVHGIAEGLAPLAESLKQGAVDLAPEKRQRIEAALSQLPKVTGALHEAADKGDAAATRRELERLDGVLTLIRTHYPPELLEKLPEHGETPSPSGASGHAHGSHTHATRPLAAVDEPARSTVHVLATEFAFEPRTLTLVAGEPTRIELENRGRVEHALIVSDPDGNGDWIHLHAQAHATASGTFRIDQPGKYAVMCTVAGHPEAGMLGQLVVQE